MLEKNLWANHVRPALGAAYHLRVENRLAPGTPDVFVSYRFNGRRTVAGWLEVKSLRQVRWPAPLYRSHLNLTHDQVVTLRRLGATGALSAVLVSCGGEYALLDGETLPLDERPSLSTLLHFSLPLREMRELLLGQLADLCP